MNTCEQGLVAKWHVVTKSKKWNKQITNKYCFETFTQLRSIGLIYFRCKRVVKLATLFYNMLSEEMFS